MACIHVHNHNLCSQDRNIVPDVFQKPEKLHLTLGVMRIFSQEEQVRYIHRYIPA